MSNRFLTKKEARDLKKAKEQEKWDELRRGKELRDSFGKEVDLISFGDAARQLEMDPDERSPTS